MITLANDFGKEDFTMIEDMNNGESFVILDSAWEDVYLMCNNDTFVELTTGNVYGIDDNRDLPVRKFDFTLVKK